MPTHEDSQSMVWIKCLLVCVIIILPARCYNGFYLHAFAASSNISVQYLNLVDAAILLTTCIYSIGRNKLYVESRIFRIILIYLGIDLFMLIMCLVFGKTDYIGELISKSIIVLCAGIIASQVRLFNDIQKSSIYVFSLGVLVIASFFLSGYKGYAVMNRVGSLGFGTNETANFACVILAIALFVTNINIWVRVGTSLVAVACILNVASRRGVIVALAIPVIWLFANLWKRRSSKIASRSFFAGLVILLLATAFVMLRHEQIISYINNSALMVRYRFNTKYNIEFLDYSGRLSIYDEAFEYIKEHLFLGSYGCDKVFAQGHITHAHNLLLQFIATYGIVFGLLFAIYVVVTFIRALKIMKEYLSRRDQAFPAIVSLFFVLYFIFEMFGYLLWNPKGLFWIALTMFLIGIEYRDYVMTDSNPEG